jgi:type II secretory pathway predicted ATPase ExeA
MDNAAIIKYFALNEHPFMTSPDPRFLYFSSQVKEALAKCEFMARDRIGPIYMYDQSEAEKLPLSGDSKKNLAKTNGIMSNSSFLRT